MNVTPGSVRIRIVNLRRLTHLLEEGRAKADDGEIGLGVEVCARGRTGTTGVIAGGGAGAGAGIGGAGPLVGRAWVW
jgi:hypothetical protein